MRDLARRKASTYTQDNTNIINAHTDLYVLSGIRTLFPSIPAGEDNFCLRPRDHCDILRCVLRTTVHTALQSR
jgi:hypothetical protein